ncbi:hypothetical protein B0T17DRAFT_519867 [Bombardia bombarda]|uniref:Secreted protein n=1 Tax=Bombardia bombarda TaxID=252184 RepID=A0AA39XNB8_9PEZI|nr:hypothetical protein B0T17DRAFT_519867 [Bombardia bombarda]
MRRGLLDLSSILAFCGILRPTSCCRKLGPQNIMIPFSSGTANATDLSTICAPGKQPCGLSSILRTGLAHLPEDSWGETAMRFRAKIARAGPRRGPGGG